MLGLDRASISVLPLHFLCDTRYLLFRDELAGELFMTNGNSNDVCSNKLTMLAATWTMGKGTEPAQAAVSLRSTNTGRAAAGSASATFKLALTIRGVWDERRLMALRVKVLESLECTLLIRSIKSSKWLLKSS